MRSRLWTKRSHCSITNGRSRAVASRAPANSPFTWHARSSVGRQQTTAAWLVARRLVMFGIPDYRGDAHDQTPAGCGFPHPYTHARCLLRHRVASRRHAPLAGGREPPRATVSEPCQMPPETPVEHRSLPTHTEGHRCRGKCLAGSALLRFDVRRYAAPESISKRAPSTTRTSLRLESSAYEQPEPRLPQARTDFLVFFDHLWIQRFTSKHGQIATRIVSDPLILCDHLRAPASSPNRLTGSARGNAVRYQNPAEKFGPSGSRPAAVKRVSRIPKVNRSRLLRSHPIVGSAPAPPSVRFLCGSPHSSCVTPI